MNILRKLLKSLERSEPQTPKNNKIHSIPEQQSDIPCEWCEPTSPATHVVTVIDNTDETYVWDHSPMCDRHSNNARSRVEVANVMRLEDVYSLKITRIKS